MRTNRGKIPKNSWPRAVVRKWLNIPTKGDEIHSDYSVKNATESRRKSCSDQDHYVVVPDDVADGWLMDETYGPSFAQEAPAVKSQSQDVRGDMECWRQVTTRGLELKRMV